MRKIGIFGGSFDPIHLAHISLAKDAREQCQLEKVILMPAHQQPFKTDKKVTPAEDRLEMTKLAAEGIEGLEVSDYEIRSEGVSYTYLTMRAMKERYPDADLYFITGTDAFLMIESWKEAEELLTNYAFIIGTRPGYKAAELNLCMEQVRETYGTQVLNIHNTQYNMSSTQIRLLAEEGGSLEGLLSPQVEEYIKEKDLYR